jgi:hypothetical protein
MNSEREMWSTEGNILNPHIALCVLRSAFPKHA